jgi:hypothetical protein
VSLSSEFISFAIIFFSRAGLSRTPLAARFFAGGFTAFFPALFAISDIRFASCRAAAVRG